MYDNSIQEQIRQVEAKISDLRFKLTVEESVLKRLKAINGPEQATTPIVPIPSVTRQGTLIEEIRAVLSEKNRAMHVREIAPILESKGVTTGAKAGLQVAIACSLHRRNDLFHKVRHGTYELVKADKTE
jgi:hypothetical protein